jgi:hypothetical protein
VGNYRRELLRSAIVAIMSASLLGATTYFIFQSDRGTIPIAFALGEDGQFSENYSLLEGSSLILQLTYLNGSVATTPTPSREKMNQVGIFNEYDGEFNGTELQKITVSVFDFDSFLYNNSTDVRYLVTWFRDRIVNATLADQDQKTADLGTSKSIGRHWNMQSGRIGDPKQEQYKLLLDAIKASFNVTVKEFYSTRYWKATDYVWAISANQLAELLHGSGTINITFTMDISNELTYSIIRTPEEDITGNATVSWTGTWGTLQLTHEEGKISSVNYNFKIIRLVMSINE